MMRRNVYVIGLMILCFLFVSGCHQKVGEKKYSEIEKLIVDYEYDSNTFRRVQVDFFSKEKLVIDYIGDTSTESICTIENCDELLKYIENNILQNQGNTDNWKGVDNSERKMIWRIKIRTDVDDLNLYGTEGEEYPTFWNGLLNLL